MQRRIFIALCLITMATCGHPESRSRRLVLHSDDDMAGEILRLKDELAALKAEVNQMKATGGMSASGSTYTRWGRTSCTGNGTELVYKGYMAGAEWTFSGSGANHLCLPDDPTWDKYVASQSTGATIAGTEIQVPDEIAMVLFGKIVTNQDVPCAVCRSSRNSQHMVPGRSDCYPGWTREYGGYLASSHNMWKANADYVCVDSGLEFLPHGMTDDNQHVILIVQAHCGSLACPPYYENRELACVVCSK